MNLKLKIPDNTKVISFSNLQTAAWLNPSLATITQPACEIGRETAAILFRLVEKKKHNFLPGKTVLKSELIEEVRRPRRKKKISSLHDD